jgi:hypothetical protein
MKSYSTEASNKKGHEYVLRNKARDDQSEQRDELHKPTTHTTKRSGTQRTVIRKVWKSGWIPNAKQKAKGCAL